MTEPALILAEANRRPMRVLEPNPIRTTPLRRIMELYAHRAMDLDEPCEIVVHRRKLYALVCILSRPYGWTSQYVYHPRCRYADRARFTIGSTTLLVDALGIAPRDTLVVEGFWCPGDGGPRSVSRCRYTAPAAPVK